MGLTARDEKKMAGTKSQWILDVTEATFEHDVAEQSLTRPVVVDFWAPWCGPCKQLGPLLEKLAVEFDGRFALAKIDTDANQNLAAAFGVQSIPYVIAISNGRPVGDFVGLKSEPELREWLKSIFPSPFEELVRQGQQLEETDPQGAEQAYRAALEIQPHDMIRVFLARVLLAQGRDDESRDVITQLEARGFLEPDAQRVKNELDIRAAAGEAGSVREARAAAAANPGDLSLQIKLADVLAVERKFKDALEICLEVVRADKMGVGQQAKETMVKIFDMVGPAAELTGEYRRKLATLLY